MTNTYSQILLGEINFEQLQVWKIAIIFKKIFSYSLLLNFSAIYVSIYRDEFKIKLSLSCTVLHLTRTEVAHY